MTTFVIERPIPAIGGSTHAELQAIAQKSCSVLDQLGDGIAWLHSYVTPDKIYCVYQAETPELVLEHARRGGFPADSVVPVQAVIDPATATG